LEGLGLNPGFLISQIVNFALLLILLRVFLYKPILKMLDERRQRIARSMEDAEKTAEARQKAEEEYQRQAEEMAQERERLRAEMTEEVAREREKLLAQARTEAEDILADARAQVEREREQMLKDLRGQVVALAIAAANKVIGEALDEERQRRLVEEFFSGIRAGRVVILDEARLAGMAGQPAKVTSALPLSAEEQKTIGQGLAQQLRGEPSVEFAVDPAILGGLIIRVGDRVVDGSVAGQLESLRTSLS
jgi:F-type H+-transporting ATPase subunit b